MVSITERLHRQTPNALLRTPSQSRESAKPTFSRYAGALVPFSFPPTVHRHLTEIVRAKIINCEIKAIYLLTFTDYILFLMAIYPLKE